MTHFTNKRGYVTDVHGIHICGYIGNQPIAVLYQDNRDNKVGEQRTAKIYRNNVGIFFNCSGKRVYVYKFEGVSV